MNDIIGSMALLFGIFMAALISVTLLIIVVNIYVQISAKSIYYVNLLWWYCSYKTSILYKICCALSCIPLLNLMTFIALYLLKLECVTLEDEYMYNKYKKQLRLKECER